MLTFPTKASGMGEETIVLEFIQIKFLFYLYRKEKFNQNHKEAVIERHSEKWRS